MNFSKKIISESSKSPESRIIERFAPYAIFPYERCLTLPDSQECYVASQDSTTPPAPRPHKRQRHSESNPLEKKAERLLLKTQSLTNAYTAILQNLKKESKKPELPEKRLDIEFPHYHTDRRSPSEFCAVDYQNKKYRKHMEDFTNHGFISSKNHSGKFIILCDGHGNPQKAPEGLDCAEYYGTKIPKKFETYLNQKQRIETALLRAFKHVDATSKKELEASLSAGSTAAFVFITDTEIHIANCGDSSVWLYSHGLTYKLTLDHELTDLKPKEKDRLKKSDLKYSPPYLVAKDGTGLNMTRTLGNHNFAGNKVLTSGHKGAISGTPDVFTIPRHPEDEFIILGCDGIGNMLRCVDITKLAQRHKTTEALTTALLEAALKKGSTDNCSVAVQKLK